MALAAALLAAASAAAHTPGAPPVSRQGSFVLGPSGEANSTLHVYLTDFSLPISVGDTLEVNWSANNGSGPALNFEIHSHAGLTGYVSYYKETAAYLNMTWKVPDTKDNSTFMVLFENPTIAPINVTYSFLLTAPPPDFGPLFFLFPAVAGVAFGWFLYIRAGRPGAKHEGEGPDRAATRGDGSEE